MKTRRKRVVDSRPAVSAKRVPSSDAPAILADDSPLAVHLPNSQPTQSTTLAHHREFELHLVKRGVGAYFIRDRRVPFRKNTLVMIPANLTHRFAPDPGTRVEKYTLIFCPQRCRRMSAAIRRAAASPTALALSEREMTDIEMVLGSMAAECAARKPYRSDALALQLRLLFLLIRRATAGQTAARGSEDKPSHALVTWCATAIEKRFAEQLTLRELARESGYSQYHLAHLFKRVTGLSVKQYILQRRIAEARRILLEQNGLTVDAVARQVGFSDFALFNRCFKRMTGVSPTLYRKISHLERND